MIKSEKFDEENIIQTTSATDSGETGTSSDQTKSSRPKKTKKQKRNRDYLACDMSSEEDLDFDLDIEC